MYCKVQKGPPMSVHYIACYCRFAILAGLLATCIEALKVELLCLQLRMAEIVPVQYAHLYVQIVAYVGYRD
jgi:hypothetical protein